jgi:hypothetical protein
MTDRITVLSLVFICSVLITNGQTRFRHDKSKFVVVPPEQILVTVAAQPGSPLQFEEVRYLANINGGGSPSFLVRNQSTKPIRSFTVGGVDWTMSWSEQFTHRLLMPGERAESDDVEIVKLSDPLRDKLNLKGPMRSILVLMTVKVEFADGTVFNAEPTYKALEAFSERLYELSTRKPK